MLLVTVWRSASRTLNINIDINKQEPDNRGIGKSDCVTGRITSTRPVHNHLLPTPRLTVSYLTIQYQTTFLWMGFCEI